MMFEKAYIPYNGYYSSPFSRWQGSLQYENAIVLGAKTARNWFLKKKIDPTILDYLYFGNTVAQHRVFHGHNWAAAMLVIIRSIFRVFSFIRHARLLRRASIFAR